MSMYVLNRELTVNWILPRSMLGIDRVSLDIRVRPPKDSGRDVVYTNGAIGIDDFIEPTGGADGYATYRFTPDLEGLWEIVLTDGDENINTFYYEQFIEVETPDNHIRKVVEGTLI